MWVGSDCIKKFKIRVFDKDGTLLTGKVAEKYLKSLRDEEQEEMLREPVRQLYRQGDEQQKRFIQRVMAPKGEKSLFAPDVTVAAFPVDGAA